MRRVVPVIAGVGVVLMGAAWLWSPAASVSPGTEPVVPLAREHSVMEAWPGQSATGPLTPHPAGSKAPEAGRPLDAAPLATFFGKPLDSRGYAPFLARALDSGDGALMVNAAFVLKECPNAPSNVERASRDRGEQADPKMYEGYTQVIRYYESQFVACQTVDGSLQKLYFPLLLKAAELGEVGAAALFALNKLDRGEPIRDEELPTIAARLVADAEAGHESSMAALAFEGRRYGVSEGQMADYKAALLIVSQRKPSDFMTEATTRALTAELGSVAVPNQHVQQLVRAWSARPH